MSGLPVLVSLLLLVFPWPASAVTADGEDVRTLLIRRNPFQTKRPSPARGQAPVADAVTDAVTNAAPGEAEPKSLRLRAVISDAKRPLVNIDGNILGIGETIEGYRVTAVREREAVLNGKGKQLILSIDGEAQR